MGSQVLGALVACVGVMILFVASVSDGGVVVHTEIFVALTCVGVLLGALGRIESAIHTVEEPSRAAGCLGLLLMLLPICATALACFVIFFYADGVYWLLAPVVGLGG